MSFQRGIANTVAISSSEASSARVPSRRVTTAVGSLLMAIAAIAATSVSPAQI